MKKLIILRGNSGSGKTTVAKALQVRLGANTMLLSQDVIRRDMLNVKDGERTEALPLLTELLEYGNLHCETVILEGILNDKWYRPLFESANRLYGNEVYAYYFDLPFEETLKRHETKPNCHEFGEEAMRRWWIEKDYSPALRETPLTQEQDFDCIVEKIIQDLGSSSACVK